MENPGFLASVMRRLSAAPRGTRTHHIYMIAEATRQNGFAWFVSRAVRKLLVAPHSILIFVLGYPLCKLFNIKFINVNTRAIGHLCIDVDFYLKEGMLGLRPGCNTVLLAPKKHVANAHLLGYWEKYLTVIKSPLLYFLLRALQPQVPLTYGRTTTGIAEIAGKYAGKPPLFSLTDDDRNRGWALLRELGVPGDAWFVCVHAREDGYEGYQSNRGQRYRNSDIRDYLPAIRAIVDRGGWVVRVGDPSMRPLQEMDRVIDYVHLPAKSDWMDIFLAASCRCFVGCASGLCCVAEVFGRPTVKVNMAPFCHALSHYRTDDIGIPKLVWSMREERYLRFAEILNSPIGGFWSDRHFDEAGVRVIDNSPNEIEEAVTEMLDGIDAKMAYTDLDEDLQTRFRSLINPTHYSYGGLSRIGRDFLKKHAALL